MECVSDIAQQRSCVCVCAYNTYVCLAEKQGKKEKKRVANRAKQGEERKRKEKKDEDELVVVVFGLKREELGVGMHLERRNIINRVDLSIFFLRRRGLDFAFEFKERWRE
jgi:hypothetical protein